MNKITAVIVTAITAVAMSACSGGSEPAVTHTETVTSSPQEVSPTSPESADVDSLFVEVIRDEFPNIQGSDEDIIAVGHSVCGALDSGQPIDKIADDIVETSGGFNYYDAGFIIGASIPAFCPKHQNQIV